MSPALILQRPNILYIVMMEKHMRERKLQKCAQIINGLWLLKYVGRPTARQITMEQKCSRKHIVFPQIKGER